MEGNQFVDAESYTGGGKDKLTFREIVLLHLKRIGEYASCEFRGGYWDEKTMHTGSVSNVIRTYVPDTREIYSNSVEYLHDLLYPHFDEEMKKASKKTQEEDDKAHHDNTIFKQEDREDQTPSEAEGYRAYRDVKDRRSYRSERVRINRRMFQALSSFLHRRKYLEGATFDDEV